MIDAILNGKHAAVADAYTALTTSAKTKEKLFEKDTKNKNMDVADENERVFYSKILRTLGMDANDENVNAAKKLQSHEVRLTRENVQSFLIAKNSMEEISASLDYENVIRLSKMGLDIENESLQKIALSLGELEEEKEGLSILKMFGKKELSTEQAEEIANKVYGSSMGKDITDIIKSLHKAGESITKKNIEKINDVFYKLDKLSDIKDQTFIDTIKNELDVSIGNLYNIKRFVKTGEIEKAQGTEAAIIKGYEAAGQTKRAISAAELQLLEDDIKALLDEMGLVASQDNVELSKEFIKRDIPVTNENIASIKEMKEALESVIRALDIDKAVQLSKSGVDVEKEDIRELAEKIRHLEVINQEDTKHLDRNEYEKIKETLEKIESLKKIEEKDLLNLLKKNVSFKISKIEQIILGKIEEPKPIIESVLGTAANSISKIAEAFREIGDLDLKTVAFHMKNSIPMTLENIQSSTMWISGKVKNLDVKLPENEANVQAPTIMGDMEEAVIKKYMQLNGSVDRNAVEAARALVQNGLQISSSNIQRAIDIYGSYSNVRDNLTSDMVMSSAHIGTHIESVDIQAVSRYVDAYEKMSDKNQLTPIEGKAVLGQGYEDKLVFGKNLMENILDLCRESENNIAFLIKNSRMLSLGELQKTYSMLKNKDQAGHKISEIADFIYEKGDENSIKEIEKLRKAVDEISKSLRAPERKLDDAYKEMEEALKHLEKNIKLQNDESNDALSKKFKELHETIEQSRKTSAESKIIQLPIYMNGQFTNLNMYFTDRRKGSAKMNSEDMVAIISISTASMGNVKMGLEIQKKSVNLKIELENASDRVYMEKHKGMLEDLFSQIGYKLGEMTFHEDEQGGALKNEEPEKEMPMSRGALDIKI
ncbi:MAG: hypothetical protein GT589_03445 [Peptoclostridium sp.]|uniref:DUF6240 domain-containing protein n=1 Tax=Peptoclostridium sp. TaxID=1904860 RepID=UPI00139C36D4|nr:DUF6240 domain-containing protein [Peptoclostridium sp.]MZQ75196.1 hypothetical protein [Peptoclostridium sp.]